MASSKSLLVVVWLFLCSLGLTSVYHGIFGDGGNCWDSRPHMEETATKAVLSTWRASSRTTTNDADASTVSTTTTTSSLTKLDFAGFDDELIPRNTTFDVNIGTNNSPIGAQDGRHRILVDPLFYICDQNAKLGGSNHNNTVTAFCFAVSDYTGFATFYEYNTDGVSSSLSQVSRGTSHGRFRVKRKRTVLVLQASVLLHAMAAKGSTVHRLKLDMQGHELRALQDMAPLLQEETPLVTHILAECFCPKKTKAGSNTTTKQIYQVDNNCATIVEVLQSVGYQARGGCGKREWGDVQAYKIGRANDYLPKTAFASVNHQYDSESE